jgi:hypothetical protein
MKNPRFFNGASYGVAVFDKAEMLAERFRRMLDAADYEIMAKDLCRGI